MRNLLNQFIRIVEHSEEFERQMAAYERVAKSDEWSFVRDTILSIKGAILRDVFSLQFTNLTEREKDVRQRAYYNINELLDFLLSPTAWIKLKRSRWQAFTDHAKRKAKPTSES